MLLPDVAYGWWFGCLLSSFSLLCLCCGLAADSGTDVEADCPDQGRRLHGTTHAYLREKASDNDSGQVLSFGGSGKSTDWIWPLVSLARASTPCKRRPTLWRRIIVGSEQDSGARQDQRASDASFLGFVRRESSASFFRRPFGETRKQTLHSPILPEPLTHLPHLHG
ncbi:uncharacterized protein IWZ02DRAFT_59167 [Phyllosticta citriasiana]|uniref:uncharacterized protein n=1 Tax=Phyllosticta citriasiana TaxID=595635 RepID=UPI0030FD76BD